MLSTSTKLYEKLIFAWNYKLEWAPGYEVYPDT